MPTTSGSGAPLDALRNFADELKRSYSSQVAAQEEDQLKGPTGHLLSAFGGAFGLDVLPRFEAPVEGIGRPDVALDVGGALCGYVELKAPSVNVRNLRGRDRDQFGKFVSLPNLVYTNGHEWILYQEGEKKRTVRLSGDVIEDGAGAVEERDAEALSALLRGFLTWEPIVPASPAALAGVLAPLCHLLRDDVLEAVARPDSSLSVLAAGWRDLLFPDASDSQFADAYAQTLTYALLLARFSGARDLGTASAADALQEEHGLLAQTLRVLADPQAREEISLGVGLLERSITAVDPDAVAEEDDDPWLYFYEDFLAAYDRSLRNDRGVYYTPAEVVRCQVRLVSELLVEKMGKGLSFADDGVVVLDPAAGTGTYPLAVIQQGLKAAAGTYGSGPAATQMARNVHAFELLVGPYAVARLRVSKEVLDAGGSLPEDGARVYLTDTLESPNAAPPGRLALFERPLAEEHRRALQVKRNKEVLVCIGNPPYNRHEGGEAVAHSGGWVRRGEGGDEPEDAIFQGFLEPARRAGAGGHVHNVYNDYVYFWRWALWKVFETKQGPGVVSFITAASYLRGPGFVGVREVMRRTFDDLWIVDVGGGTGPRPSKNVFNIQTPVAIAIGVRYGEARPEEPARVRYAKVEGDREEKLAALDAVASFGGLDWEDCFGDWQGLFLPERTGPYFSWPRLTDLFPWQQGGVKVGRTWPVAHDPELLQRRWSELAASGGTRRKRLFKDSPTGKRHDSPVNPRLLPPPASDARISELEGADAPPPVVRYGFRSFDRQHLLADNRLLDRAGPPLWAAHGGRQVYMTTLLTEALGRGPAAAASAEIPDLHHFRGSYGGKDVIPLWRDAEAETPNVTGGLLEALSEAHGERVGPEDLFAYAYAVLSCPSYVDLYWDELTVPGPRLPLTKDASLFRRGASLGRELLRLHTYGERLAGDGPGGGVAQGEARFVEGIPDAPEAYPEGFSYDPETQTLSVGAGRVRPVRPELWSFAVSGHEVLKSWLNYRKKEGAGRRSSPLDDLRPERWTLRMSRDLLELLWVLEATVDKGPELSALLEEVVASDCFAADELPEPMGEEREPPSFRAEATQDALIPDERSATG